MAKNNIAQNNTNNKKSYLFWERYLTIKNKLEDNIKKLQNNCNTIGKYYKEGPGKDVLSLYESYNELIKRTNDLYNLSEDISYNLGLYAYYMDNKKNPAQKHAHKIANLLSKHNDVYKKLYKLIDYLNQKTIEIEPHYLSTITNPNDYLKTINDTKKEFDKYNEDLNKTIRKTIKSLKKSKQKISKYVNEEDINRLNKLLYCVNELYSYGKKGDEYNNFISKIDNNDQKLEEFHYYLKKLIDSNESSIKLIETCRNKNETDLSIALNLINSYQEIPDEPAIKQLTEQINSEVEICNWNISNENKFIPKIKQCLEKMKSTGDIDNEMVASINYASVRKSQLDEATSSIKESKNRREETYETIKNIQRDKFFKELNIQDKRFNSIKNISIIGGPSSKNAYGSYIYEDTKQTTKNPRISSPRNASNPRENSIVGSSCATVGTSL